MRRPLNAKTTPGTVRIIGGTWRGRRVALPAEAGTRPTPDRVRETLFNWLADVVVGSRCLDLFAGSGVLGLEALSRGAAELVCVERDRRMAASIREHLERFGGEATVLATSAERYLRSTEKRQFDLVLLDPPYDSRMIPLLEQVHSILDAAGSVYVERAADEGLPELSWGHWHRRSVAGNVAFGLVKPGPPPE